MARNGGPLGKSWMICPGCGAAVERPTKFCGDCGAPLPWVCVGCGRENPTGKRFCQECGAAATAVAAGERERLGGSPVERRQLSVLFADLVGSAALGERL